MNGFQPRSLFLNGLVALTAMATLAASLSAHAEVTVEDLTGTAISGVGPYYQDVADAIRRASVKDMNGRWRIWKRPRKRCRVWRRPKS